jgi:hypothetical protein
VQAETFENFPSSMFLFKKLTVNTKWIFCEFYAKNLFNLSNFIFYYVISPYAFKDLSDLFAQKLFKFDVHISFQHFFHFKVELSSFLIFSTEIFI